MPTRPNLAWHWQALALVWLLLSGSPFAAQAQSLRPVPALSGRVIDQTGSLSAVQAQALSAQLAAVEQQHGSQWVVLMVDSVQPEDIAAYALRVGEDWKIGRKGIGDGLLLVVAKGDRKVRIEVAKGLEGVIPDVIADRVIRSAIAPAFREGDYAGGLSRAIAALAERLTLDPVEAPASSPTARSAERGSTAPELDALLLPLLLAAGVLGGGAMLSARVGRKWGSLATGLAAAGVGGVFSGSLLLGLGLGLAALLVMAFWAQGAARRGLGPSSGIDSHAALALLWGALSSGSGRAGGGGFGDDFRSGGGGDFGGGGASGDW